jgi:hypothetical protein
MTDKIKKRIEDVKAMKEISYQKAKEGSFADKLIVKSFDDHITELRQIQNTTSSISLDEIFEVRLKADDLSSGSIPLYLISRASESIRTMIGYTAVRLMQGRIFNKRVPRDLYGSLNLRLAGILPGSSRIVVTANSDRDMFDYGLAKQTFERIFSVLKSNGEGQEFLEAVTTLGPSGARHLRDLLYTIKQFNAESDITWNFAGSICNSWEGTYEKIGNVLSALNVTEINNQEMETITGRIEVLSKREKMEIRTQDNSLMKLLYPNRLLPIVATLHLEQEVTLQIQTTETNNPLTSERSISHELVSVLNL